MRLAKQYGPERVEAASARAVAVGARSYRHVAAMLKHGLDRVPLDDAESSARRPDYDNVRGPAYYQQELPHAPCGRPERPQYGTPLGSRLRKSL